MKDTYRIDIEAPSEADAKTKIAALDVLQKRLSAKELKQLAHVIKSDPDKLALAKKYLWA
jgi:hypothetical protein